jgi:predicted nucleic acid-binding protein
MLVLDTSVILNVLGSGRPKFLLSHLPYRVVVPPSVLQEVKREPDLTVDKDACFGDLIECGLITVLGPNNKVDDIAIALAGAESPNDLDDGEAYAIAYAVVLGAAIGIDERKGRRIISEQWPTLNCLFAIEIIEGAATTAKLNAEELGAIVFSALRHSRMRVPTSRRADIIALIGNERARECSSLGSIAD